MQKLSTWQFFTHMPHLAPRSNFDIQITDRQNVDNITENVYFIYVQASLRGLVIANTN
jgi:hypothetical protein